MSGKIEQTCIVDDRSVSIEEAVAKMIGWMRTEQRLVHIQVTEEGIDRSQFHQLAKLPAPLFEIINEEREAARLKLYEAADQWFQSTKLPAVSPVAAEELFRITAAREADLEYWDDIQQKASMYLTAIDRTLSRKNGPLKVDQRDPVRISTSSLRDWAKRQYKIDIDGQTTARIPSKSSHGALIELAILNAIKTLGYDATGIPKEHDSKTPGVKAKVKEQLMQNASVLFQPQQQTKHSLKPYQTALFNKHWQRLIKRQAIIYATSR